MKSDQEIKQSMIYVSVRPALWINLESAAF